MKHLSPSIFALTLALISVDARADIFREPQKLCHLLTDEGFTLAEPWKQNTWQDYACATAYYPLSKTNAVPTNIAYYAESEVEDEVTTVYLVLNINDDGFREQGKAKYLKAVQTLLKQMAVDDPDSVINTIESETPQSFERDFGIIRFEVLRGATDTLRLSIHNRNG